MNTVVVYERLFHADEQIKNAKDQSELLNIRESVLSLFNETASAHFETIPETANRVRPYNIDLADVLDKIHEKWLELENE